MEIKEINKEDIVLWSRPQKIKERWFNAVIEKPIFEDRNIQFIMKCNFYKLEYIVVSTKELSLEEIEDINLNNYIFEGIGNFVKGERR